MLSTASYASLFTVDSPLLDKLDQVLRRRIAAPQHLIKLFWVIYFL
jgi:hypothetical protein